MADKLIILWRWDKPSKKFMPTENELLIENKIRLKSHNNVVRAGLHPNDWREYVTGNDEILHKIVLTRQQAKKCVVAETEFTEKEITKFAEKMDIPIVNSEEKYICANYEKSFVPLLEYSGGYNLPEVLIPFPVEAKKCVFCSSYYSTLKSKKTDKLTF